MISYFLIHLSKAITSDYSVLIYDSHFLILNINLLFPLSANWWFIFMIIKTSMLFSTLYFSSPRLKLWFTSFLMVFFLKVLHFNLNKTQIDRHIKLKLNYVLLVVKLMQEVLLAYYPLILILLLYLDPKSIKSLIHPKHMLQNVPLKP